MTGTTRIARTLMWRAEGATRDLHPILRDDSSTLPSRLCATLSCMRGRAGSKWIFVTVTTRFVYVFATTERASSHRSSRTKGARDIGVARDDGTSQNHRRESGEQRSVRYGSEADDSGAVCLRQRHPTACKIFPGREASQSMSLVRGWLNSSMRQRLKSRIPNS